MMDKIWYFVMVPMVYASVAWCVFWVVVKIVGVLRTPNRPVTLRIFPEGKDPNDTSGGGLAAVLIEG